MTESLKEGRKPLYCDRKDCGNVVAWSPGMLVYAKTDKDRKHPLVSQTILAICEEHKAETTVDDVLTDEGWEIICVMLAKLGKCPPKRSWTVVTWRKVVPGQPLTFDFRGPGTSDVMLPGR